MSFYAVWAPFLLGDEAIYVSDGRKVLVKLDRTSLEELWRVEARLFPVAECGSGSVLVVEDIKNGTACGIDNRTGEKIWDHPRGLTGSWIWDGQVVLPGRDTIVVDAHTGNVLRAFPLEGLDLDGGAKVIRAVLIHDQVLAKLSGFDLRSEVYRWSKRFDELLQTGPNGLIRFRPGPESTFFVNDDRRLARCDLGSGATLWAVDITVPSGGLVHHDDAIYVMLADADYAADLARLSVSDGIERFRVRHELGGFMEFGQGAVHGQELIFSADVGLLMALSQNTGELAWKHRYKEQLFAPVVDRDRILVPSADGKLLVFE